MAEFSADKIYGILVEIKKMASTASLTGSMGKGTPMLIDMFNKCLRAIESKDDTAGAIFSELPETTSVDEVGVAAALLSGYIRSDETCECGREGGLQVGIGRLGGRLSRVLLHQHEEEDSD
jgi:hypothetical protein